MIQDVWNPTEAEIRDWAYSTNDWPDQDWEMAVNNQGHDRLLIELASDLKCPQRKFFLHAIYFMIGDVFHAGKIDSERMSRIQNLNTLLTALPHQLPDDVSKWRNEALSILTDDRLIKNPSLLDYRYWCQYGF